MDTINTLNFVSTLPTQSTIYKHKTTSQRVKARSCGYTLKLRVAVNNSETAKAIQAS